MTRLRVHNLSVSLDGFAAGEPQTLEAPMGHAAGRLHQWFFPTRTFQAMTGRPGGSEGVDDAFAARTNDGIGAEIMGRGKFAPTDEPAGWQGWWGDEPPFRTPVIVLTHRPRPPLTLANTTFTFVDATPGEALRIAAEQAGGLDVRLGGGAATVREFLDADLVDHLHVVVVPIVLGRGSRLWDGQEGLEDRFAIDSTPSPSGVVHLTLSRKPRG